MKKIMSIVLAAALVAVMTVSVCAVDTSYIHIQPQVWAQDTPNYAVWTPLKDATGVENQIGLGETKTVVYTGEAWKTITTADGGSYQYGIQILDGTIGQTQAVIGDKTTIKYEISDITIKATGYDDYVVPCAGVYEAALEAYEPSWGGIAGNTHVPMAFDFTAVAGGSDGASLTAYFQAIETVTFTITYLEYNGEGPAVEDTPAVEEPVEETPAEGDAPVEVALYFGNSVDGAFNHGEPVAITGPGEYTFTYSGIGHLAFDMTVLFIKDVAVEDKLATSTNLPADTEIITKSVKINGQEIALTEGYPTTLTDSGVFDVCYFNTWATSYFSTSGLGMIDNAEVVVEIKYTEEAPAVEETPVVEDTPAEEEPADTGLALAVVPMIVAAAAVVLSKKR